MKKGEAWGLCPFVFNRRDLELVSIRVYERMPRYAFEFLWSCRTLLRWLIEIGAVAVLSLPQILMTPFVISSAKMVTHYIFGVGEPN